MMLHYNKVVIYKKRKGFVIYTLKFNSITA